MSTQLENLRKKIDEIDRKILADLSERFLIIKKIGEYKAGHNLPIADKKREKEMFAGIKGLAKNFKLDERLVDKIFKIIIKAAKESHKKAKER